MTNPPSAAQALYPNLPTGERDERQQSGPRLADAMYPRPSQPRLSQDEVRARWRDRMMEMAGLRRKP